MTTLLLEDKMMKYAKMYDDTYREDFYLDEEADYARLDDYAPYIHRQVYTEHGASKFVIIDKSCSHVVKIPFHGTEHYEDIYNEETDEYEYTDDSYFEDFYGAMTDGWNYCGDEAYIYSLAEEAGFEKFFAETKLLTYTKREGIPIYIQERVESFSRGKTKSKASEKSKEIAEVYHNNVHLARIHKDWIADAIEFYGEDYVREFLEWYKEYANDLHSGNIGYRFNGEPVILDYSGYHG